MNADSPLQLRRNSMVGVRLESELSLMPIFFLGVQPNCLDVRSVSIIFEPPLPFCTVREVTQRECVVGRSIGEVHGPLRPTATTG